MLQMAVKTRPQETLPKGVRFDAKRGDYVWQVKRVNEDGTTFRKVGYEKNPKDANRARDAAIQAHEQGQTQQSQVPTFGEWCEYFKTEILPVMPSRKGEPYSATTVQSYVPIIDNSLIGLLGDILLTKMTPEHVEAMLKTVGGEVQTRLNVRNLGSKIYEVAQLRGKVPHGYNPFKAVQIAKAKTKRDEDGNEISHVRLLTKDDEAHMMQVASTQWCYGAILLAIKCGLRQGEVLGLEWANVDLERKVINVRQQRQRISKKTRDLMGIKAKGGLMKVNPKTDAGFRTIPLPASMFDWLRAERETNKTPFVIPNTLGNNPREPRRLTEYFKNVVDICKLKIADENGTPLAVPTFHDLRHTWCTRHANDYKTPPHVLCKLAGHSRIETTLGYYVHAEEGDLFSAQANVA